MYFPFCFVERNEKIPALEVGSGSTISLDFSITTGAAVNVVSGAGLGLEESPEGTGLGWG